MHFKNQFTRHWKTFDTQLAYKDSRPILSIITAVFSLFKLILSQMTCIGIEWLDEITQIVLLNNKSFSYLVSQIKLTSDNTDIYTIMAKKIDALWFLEDNCIWQQKWIQNGWPMLSYIRRGPSEHIQRCTEPLAQ